MKLWLGFLFVLSLCSAACAREAKLLEGSVDACELLQESEVQKALGAQQLRVDKGTIPQTWGSSCRWSAGDAFVSVVAHTKHGERTFRSLRQHLKGVKSRSDLTRDAYQSGDRIYLLKRGAYVTLEPHAALPAATVDALVKAILTKLDEVARRQEVRRG